MPNDRYCRRCGRGPLYDRYDKSAPPRMQLCSRGLDVSCYAVERLKGRLALYPLTPREPAPSGGDESGDGAQQRAEALREDYEHEYALFSDFMARSLVEAADWLGVSAATLNNALKRTGVSWRDRHRRWGPTRGDHHRR